MRNRLEVELKVGIFVTLGVALTLTSLIILGSIESLTSGKNVYYAHFQNVDGLIPGAKVVMGGLQVGVVQKVGFDHTRRDVQVNITVSRDAAGWVRRDSTVEIATQGMLGDKYLSLARGGDNEPILPPGSELVDKGGGGLAQFLSKSDQLLVSLQSIAGTTDRLLKSFEAGGKSEAFFTGMASTAKNLASATEKLNREVEDLRLKALSRNLGSIVEKINNGTGTLGALVNDPGLYDDAKALMGGANRNRIIRNLVRQTIRKNEESAAEEAATQKK
jgi:phospholipid/cholesterol/gamma-HCH transport system substrate-binding protein